MSAFPLQLDLLEPPEPPIIPGVNLRLCSVIDLLIDVRGAKLIHADPPWKYRNRQNGNAADQYQGLEMSVIVQHIGDAWACADRNAYLVVWCTFPQLEDWMAAVIEARAKGDFKWKYLSGGAWGKRVSEDERKGAGYHQRGDAEIPLLYAKGRPKPNWKYLSNWYASPRGEHSEKPVAYLREMVRAFTKPGERVTDFYAGFGSMMRACYAEGRPYEGAENDPKRHGKAMALMAMSRSQLALP